MREEHTQLKEHTGGSERVAALSEYLHEVVGQITTGKIEAQYRMR